MDGPCDTIALRASGLLASFTIDDSGATGRLDRQNIRVTHTPTPRVAIRSFKSLGLCTP